MRPSKRYEARLMSEEDWRDRCKTCILRTSCIFRRGASYCSGVIDAIPLLGLVEIIGDLDESVNLIMMMVKEDEIPLKENEVMLSPQGMLHFIKPLEGNIVRTLCGTVLHMDSLRGWRMGDFTDLGTPICSHCRNIKLNGKDVKK